MSDSRVQLQNFLKKKLMLLKEVRTFQENFEARQEALLEDFLNKEALNYRDALADRKNTFDREEDISVVVCSKMRDKTIYPNPAHYKIELDTEIENVIQAGLIQANFPVIAENIRDLEFFYSFHPFDALTKVTIPNGIFKGDSLAVEITRQMNQLLHAGAILSGAYYIEDASGLVMDTLTKARPAGATQFKVTLLTTFRRVVFQLIDDTGGVVNTPFALHFSRSSGEPMGFSEYAVTNEGVWEPTSQTYYLASNAPSSFVRLANVDKRLAYSISGNQSPNQRGRLVIVLDIDPINGEGVETGKGFKNAFGVIPIKPSFCNDGILEINSTSYPVSKVFPNGLSRIKNLTIRLLNDDGELFDFDGQEHFFTLRFKVLRNAPPRAIFCR